MPVVRVLWLQNIIQAAAADIYKGICISTLAKWAPGWALMEQRQRSWGNDSKRQL